MTGGGANAAFLERFVSRDSLEREPWPSYVLDAEGRLAFANSAWDRVARGARGPMFADVVGTPWLRHIAGLDAKRFYSGLLERLISAPREGGIRHLCDCNTPDRWRLFSSWFVPLREPHQAVASGILCITSMLEDAPVGERYRVAPQEPPDEGRYRRHDGLMLQCGGCRRMRVAHSAAGAFEWELVPSMLDRAQTDISHGICELCREVYYGKASPRSR